jgi:FkbM family methyltransferase
MKYIKTLILMTYFFFYNAYAGPQDFVKDDKIINELTTPEYVDIIRPFLPDNPHILEAGAHGGQDTVILAKSWPLGTVYAFEPVQKFVEFTRTEIVNHKVNNVQLFPLALSVSSGEQSFYYSTVVGAASSLLEDSGEVCNYQDAMMKVQCTNLDEWAQKNQVGHIDFMWLDIEGSELPVLKSAPNVLKTVRVIITEVNFLEFRKGSTQYRDLYDFLITNGFTLHQIWGNPRWQGTALFVRSESILVSDE